MPKKPTDEKDPAPPKLALVERLLRAHLLAEGKVVGIAVALHGPLGLTELSEVTNLSLGEVDLGRSSLVAAKIATDKDDVIALKEVF